MMKRTSLSNEQLKIHLMNFYEYFETGYDFEKFLKIYLEKIGLDEVNVTQRSRDGGVDLTARRSGIGGFSEADSISYYVQAKRNKPFGPKISVSKIRELKGVLPIGSKGVFITTSMFSSDAEVEAINDATRQVILIDGRKLIESCIDNEIGFVFSPVFSKTAMDRLQGEIANDNSSFQENAIENDTLTIDRMISNNDIRARIMTIPRDILAELSDDDNEIIVKINGESEKYKINKSRGFLTGVTKIFKKYGLLDADGIFYPKRATWRFYKDELSISISEDVGTHD